ncbi:MAG: cyanophycinase [Bacteroidota bacterium]
MRVFVVLAVSLFPLFLFAQSGYTSYFTGSATDVSPDTKGGVCLMGGATESDEAMQWFLLQASGGDILVLRASGSDGYNQYLYSDLNVTVNSVETIVFTDPMAAFDPYVHQRISEAEAIWFAGGNQWNYVSYWRDTPVDSLIRAGISERNLVIGGTSAGMAILGQGVFTAEQGTVTSAQALQDPYHPNMSLDSAEFMAVPFLERVITDTHYDDPDRKGRHVAFLAHTATEWGWEIRGIACDEYTAVCIDSLGMARVYGNYPTYDDNAYFLQMNCSLDSMGPELCAPGQALQWERDSAAVLVYHARGTSFGSQRFDLSNWQEGFGGSWEHWYVQQGNLVETAGIAPVCDTTRMDTTGSDTTINDTTTTGFFPEANDGPELDLVPYPDRLEVIAQRPIIQRVEILDIQGRRLESRQFTPPTLQATIPLHRDLRGFLLLQYHTTEGLVTQKWRRP